MERVLTFDEMSITQGGNFWNGFCAAVGVANILAPALAFTGVGYVIVKTAGIGCLVYKLATLE